MRKSVKIIILDCEVLTNHPYLLGVVKRLSKKRGIFDCQAHGILLELSFSVTCSEYCGVSILTLCKALWNYRTQYQKALYGYERNLHPLETWLKQDLVWLKLCGEACVRLQFTLCFFLLSIGIDGDSTSNSFAMLPFGTSVND